MSARKVTVVLLLLALLVGNLNITVFADEEVVAVDDTVVSGCHSLDAASAYLGTEKKVDNVAAAILYETNSDTLLYGWNADQKVYPSSLVKILTALIAVEKGDPQTVITVTQDALDSVPYYAASAELQAGEQLSLSDLLYALMVGSANDAAAVIATHISGSTNAFVNEMNRYALELGCTATQFTNVHGLHDENQYTTPRDLARILTAAVRNQSFLEYFSAVTHLIPATNMSEERELSSGNFLMNTENLQLYFDARAKGGRTGTTEDGRRCLATLAEQNGMQVVCVVMGSESTFDDRGNTLTYGSFKETSMLLDTCFTGYQVAQVLYEGQVLKQCSIQNGENDVILGCERSAYAVLPEGITLKDLSFRYDERLSQVSAPLESGQVVSFAQVWYGGFCIAEAELIALNSVRVKTVNAPDSVNDNDGGNAAVRIVLSVVGAALVIYFAIRGIRCLPVILRGRRRKQYRRSRRRSR